MKTTQAVILVVLAVIAGGILFMRAHNPSAFSRLRGSAASTPPTSASTSPTPKPTLPAKLAAPAVKAIQAANAKADTVLHPKDNKTAAAPAKPASAAPSPALAPSKPIAAGPPSVMAPAPAPMASPAPTAMPLPPTPTSVISVSSTLNSPSDVINAPVAPAEPSAAASLPSNASIPIMSAAPVDSSSTTAASWTPPTPTPAQPNWTWTTTTGQVYKKVKVIKMDPQSVTILHQDGGAHIPMEALPPDLQKLFNYDPAAAAQWGVGKLVAGNLVMLRNDSIVPANDALLRPVRYIAIYYSADWCPPCHAFTPQLVKFYNGFKPIHSDFEIIFVSEDHDPLAMAAYMREMNMPWLAVSYGALVHPPGTFKGSGIEAFAGNGIPDLVLLDATGRVLSDSYRDGRYVGPEAVITDIESMVK